MLILVVVHIEQDRVHLIVVNRHVSVLLQFLRRDEFATETREAQDVVQSGFVCLTGVTISDQQGDIHNARYFDDHAICDFVFEAAVSDRSWNEIAFERSHVRARTSVEEPVQPELDSLLKRASIGSGTSSLTWAIKSRPRMKSY